MKTIDCTNMYAFYEEMDLTANNTCCMASNIAMIATLIMQYINKKYCTQKTMHYFKKVEFSKPTTKINLGIV